jgi:hypothetical protein
LILLPIIGCKSSEEEAWENGYNANHGTAYHEGWQEGATRDKKEGEEKGRQAARNAAQTGSAWQFYSIFAFLALVFGIIIGVSAQYIVLVRCQESDRLPGFLTVALIPAMKSSLAYSALERRHQLMIWLEAEMTSLVALNKLRSAQIRGVHNTIVKKLKAISSIQDFTQARLLELAKKELSKIVSEAEQDAHRLVGGQKPSAQIPRRYVFACPHCSRQFEYRGKRGGKTVNCPHKNCGRPISVPRLSSSGDNVLPTLKGRETPTSWYHESTNTPS